MKTKKITPTAATATADDEEYDQFSFVEKLNKQYADAMEQRKIMKKLNRPRQNSL